MSVELEDRSHLEPKRNELSSKKKQGDADSQELPYTKFQGFYFFMEFFIYEVFVIFSDQVNG